MKKKQNIHSHDSEFKYEVSWDKVGVEEKKKFAQAHGYDGVTIKNNRSLANHWNSLHSSTRGIITT